MGINFDPEPVCCQVCQRQAAGIGWAPKQGKPIAWLCMNTDCISLGETVFKMSKNRLTVFERDALTSAGGDAGSYLESIGRFDLSELSPEEWEKFLTTVLVSYGNNMRDRLLNHKAPF